MLKDLKRLFIAVDISESMINDIKSEIYDKISIKGLKWVKAENLHLTLKFLGNVPVGDIDKISSVMEAAAKDKENITLKYTGLGVFPNLSRARVLWVGFEDASNVLENIAAEIDEGLARELGTEREKRRFTPHLTIARLKNFSGHVKLSELIKKGIEFTKDSCEVSEIVLYESVLKKTGAIYTKIKTVSLK